MPTPQIGRRPSLKLRWLIWRARLSVPSLLARSEERGVVSLATAVNGGLSILVIGLCAWLVDLPLVFPVLGPSAFILFSRPFSPEGAPRSVLIGHLSAMAVGLGSWQLVSFICGRPVSVETAEWPAFLSASLALGVSCLLLVRLSCPHAPACATALVVALGAVPDWRGLLAIVVGIVTLTMQAVCLNRIAGVSTPVWSPRRGEKSHP